MEIGGYRRIKDWDKAKDFLDTLANPLLSLASREACLANADQCGILLAPYTSGSGTLQERISRVEGGLRAMDRLSRWVIYNRKIWTQLIKQFSNVYFIASPGPTTGERKYWQRNIIFDGKISEQPLLWKNELNQLVPVGQCQTEDLECNLKPRSKSEATFNLDDVSQGHYHHTHLGIK